MNASEAGIAFTKKHEGYRSSLYHDSKGHCTIGYGHLVNLGACGPAARLTYPGQITEPQADQLFRGDLAFAEQAVNDLVRVPLSQGEFDALVDFVFNLGRTKFANSTLLRKLNAGDYEAVPREILRWDATGPAGLRRRRREEAAMFADDPSWKVSVRDGRTITEPCARFAARVAGPAANAPIARATFDYSGQYYVDDVHFAFENPKGVPWFMASSYITRTFRVNVTLNYVLWEPPKTATAKCRTEAMRYNTFVLAAVRDELAQVHDNLRFLQKTYGLNGPHAYTGVFEGGAVANALAGARALDAEWRGRDFAPLGMRYEGAGVGGGPDCSVC
jgi:GH24 family phage-related lysozyme (muramidase)